ncbi:hypothetical protein Nepgr_013512 [Nepenthes gracilis]|uniref:Uncharacterized protein n=1 Tax=Nepenthes gracilis TaxID=150966 RepID=A0AAD3XPF0_NEPGR|nr:hypothetical protein Nepgr_013512 [Nepenthes gracilis]
MLACWLGEKFRILEIHLSVYVQMCGSLNECKGHPWAVYVDFKLWLDSEGLMMSDDAAVWVLVVVKLLHLNLMQFLVGSGSFMLMLECSQVSGAVKVDGAYFDRLLVLAVSFFWTSWNTVAHGMDDLLPVVVLNCLCFCLLNHLKAAESGMGLLLERLLAPFCGAVKNGFVLLLRLLVCSCFQNLLYCIYGLLLVVVRRVCLAKSASLVWCWGWLCGISAPIADVDELVDSADPVAVAADGSWSAVDALLAGMVLSALVVEVGAAVTDELFGLAELLWMLNMVWRLAVAEE